MLRVELLVSEEMAGCRSVTLSRPFHAAGWQFDDLPCGFDMYNCSLVVLD